MDLKERSITFEAEDPTATRLSFSPEGILYEVLRLSLMTQRSVERLITTGAQDARQTPEKEPAVTLTS